MIPNMKLLINYSVAMVAILFTILACTKDEETPSGSDGNNDEYYVKYIIRGNGTYIYFNNFSVNTDLGNKSFSGYQYRSWNQTYGPVKRGFLASVSVSSSYVNVEIHVAKNNSPFVLKASKTGDRSPTSNISQSYRIDF